MKHTVLHSALLAFSIVYASGLLAAQTIQVNQNNRTIAVTASDKATADADIAVVHVGFEQFAPTADDAYEAGSQASNAVMSALKRAGVSDNAIESQGQNLNRNMQFDPKETDEERAKRQFVLSQSWTVKITAEQAALVLHTAVEAGANTSGQIDWDLKDRDRLQAQAAAKALVHARAMAEQMAQGLNAHLGALIYASNREPQVMGFGGGGGMGFIGGVAGGMLEQRKALPLAIRPQKIEESATVYAVFAIE
jgi:uncharacterized protein YggE